MAIVQCDGMVRIYTLCMGVLFVACIALSGLGWQDGIESLPLQQLSRRLSTEPMVQRPDESSMAWVTLLSASTARYTTSVAVQINQIRKFSSHPHYTFVTEDVEESEVEFLSEFNTSVVRVKNIRPPFGIKNPVWQNVLSKFLVFDKSKYSVGVQRVVYMDYDAFPVADEAVGLIDGTKCPTADLCMMWEADYYSHFDDTDKGMFNTGVFVVNNLQNTTLHEEMTAFIEQLPGDYTVSLPEQELLRDFFKARFGTMQPAQIGNLTYEYNSCFLNYTLCNGIPGDACWAYLIDTYVNVYHGCGPANKFITIPDCSQHNHSGAAAKCLSQKVRDHQAIVHTVSNCSRHEDQFTCEQGNDRAAVCQWCGNGIGCLEHKRNCLINTTDTKNMLQRDNFGDFSSLACSQTTATQQTVNGRAAAEKCGEQAAAQDCCKLLDEFKDLHVTSLVHQNNCCYFYNVSVSILNVSNSTSALLLTWDQ